MRSRSKGDLQAQTPVPEQVLLILRSWPKVLLANGYGVLCDCAVVKAQCVDAVLQCGQMPRLEACSTVAGRSELPRLSLPSQPSCPERACCWRSAPIRNTRVQASTTADAVIDEGTEIMNDPLELTARKGRSSRWQWTEFMLFCAGRRLSFSYVTLRALIAADVPLSGLEQEPWWKCLLWISLPQCS